MPWTLNYLLAADSISACACVRVRVCACAHVCGRAESWERGREERARSCWETERPKAESDSERFAAGPPGGELTTRLAAVTGD